MQSDMENNNDREGALVTRLKITLEAWCRVLIGGDNWTLKFCDSKCVHLLSIFSMLKKASIGECDTNIILPALLLGFKIMFSTRCL